MSGPREHSALAVVEKLYDAAAGGCDWASALDQLRTSLGAASAVAKVHALEPGTITFFETANIDERYQQHYLDYYAELDPWVESSLGIPTGRVCMDDALLSRDRLLSSEFYNDFLLPQEHNYALAGFMENSDQAFGRGIHESHRNALRTEHLD
jgi:hypothetical protein